jgi:hypothetical protein
MIGFLYKLATVIAPLRNGHFPFGPPGTGSDSVARTTQIASEVIANRGGFSKYISDCLQNKSPLRCLPVSPLRAASDDPGPEFISSPAG